MAKVNTDVIKVEELLDMVGRAYTDAQAEILSKRNELPPLKSATLTVTTTLGHSGELTGELLVVSGGAKKAVKSSQQISVKLGKPPQDKAVLGFIEVERDLYQDVVDAIVAGAIAAKAAHGSKIGDLVLEDVTTAVGFDVERERKGGLKFELKIFGAGLKIGADFSRERSAAHEIELVFGKPA